MSLFKLRDFEKNPKSTILRFFRKRPERRLKLGTALVKGWAIVLTDRSLLVNVMMLAMIFIFLADYVNLKSTNF